jgi:sortase (surface protein transpeptidase)
LRRAAIAVACITTTALLAECGGAAHTTTAPVAPATTMSRPVTRTTVRPRPVRSPAVPAALFAEALSVRSGPVPVPLQLLIPSINVTTQVLGVGVTSGDVMDAPEGPINDPVWQEAFWYRGSAVPGAISTALIAGHIDGPRGTSAVFGNIGRLRAGDAIIVRDTRSGLEVRFAVTSSTSFTLDQTTQPAVLQQIYGVGPVAGTTPQRSTDGLAHLTLITCAGTFRNGIGTHDHRLAVFATRVK